MKYLIYKITNNINGKIYIGKHKTEKLVVNDDFVKRTDTYNLRVGGEGGSAKGIQKSEEHKKKIGAARKGRRPSEETKKKMSEAHTL